MQRRSDLLKWAELRVEVLKPFNQFALFAELMLLNAQGGIKLLHQELDVIQPFCFLMGQQL